MTMQTKFQEFDVKWFDGKQVRRIWHDGEWWYSTADAVGAFAGSENPSKYWSVLKTRLKRDGVVDLTTICSRVKMLSPNGKRQPLDASTEQMLLRIIQSLPTVRVEHIRQWLAEVGAQRLREERQPELITERAIETNKRRYGMSNAEASQAVQGTAQRKSITSLWRERGVTDGRQYAELTNVGHQSTFDVSVRKHKDIKSLPKGENLRPHMTPVERALSMLQEATAEEIIKAKNLQGFYPLRNAATASGGIAAHARKAIEQQTKEPVVSPFNRKKQVAPRSPNNRPLPPPA